jgi:hypothetical protein
MAKTNRAKGAGRLLIAVYAVFAISATARALYQLFREFEQAPLAYSLSAISALIYIVATIALAKSAQVWSKIAWISVSAELLGVVTVGVLSFTHPELFAHPSVWSKFGQGYGYIPLILPILGLLWLRRSGAKK